MNRQPHILLVDDDADLLEIYAMALEELGCAVMTASDGQQGLERALVLQPDLIITDVSMPRMNGLELCRRLRVDERLSDIPRILHSSEYALNPPRGEVFLHKDGDLARFTEQVVSSLSHSLRLGQGWEGATFASVA